MTLRLIIYYNMIILYYKNENMLDFRFSKCGFDFCYRYYYYFKIVIESTKLSAYNHFLIVKNYTVKSNYSKIYDSGLLILKYCIGTYNQNFILVRSFSNYIHSTLKILRDF